MLLLHALTIVGVAQQKKRLLIGLHRESKKHHREFLALAAPIGGGRRHQNAIVGSGE